MKKTRMFSLAPRTSKEGKNLVRGVEGGKESVSMCERRWGHILSVRLDDDGLAGNI